MWWNKIKKTVTRFENLQVIHFPASDTGELAKLASRTMKLHVNIQDCEVMVIVGGSLLYVTPSKWKSAAVRRIPPHISKY